MSERIPEIKDISDLMSDPKLREGIVKVSHAKDEAKKIVAGDPSDLAVRERSAQVAEMIIQEQVNNGK